MNEFRKTQQIFEKLEDEYSKNIFMNRMFFHCQQTTDT